MAAKRKRDAGDDDGEFTKFDAPKHIKSQEKRLIVVLEKANLESVKVGKSFELLNCDDHIQQMRKFKKDPAFCRPDITHQCLLMLFDSPLNRAGLLQVYVRTEKNVLIEINPQTRIPRTFKRFSGLMVQLLHKLCIRAGSGSVKLLKVIKNPITDWLPVGCKKIAMSLHADKLVRPSELVPQSDEPIVVVIGAMAHGSVDPDYTEGSFSISQYPLSAALTCSKLCTAFEEAWGVH
ncbi:hypothetical protein HPB50_017670 [Hyalomma asiaticum]|uniref:Uncharacterized protein n=1 Tax=Hyalomma asiaticum TaxID=266040 RepID=A0ACB7SIF3_HYAAI|nr:hypothetical protein HPB50_017670 [Hyalomma asiaticum]